MATAAGTSIKQISSFYYEAFVSANPDRWAVTFKSGVPVLSDKKNQEVDDELAKWEAMVDDMKM